MSWSLRTPPGKAENNAPITGASSTGGWLAFTAKWPPSLLATNVIAGQRMTAGTELSCPADVSEASATGDEQTPKNSLKRSHGQIGGPRWGTSMNPNVKNLTFEC